MMKEIGNLIIAGFRGSSVSDDTRIQNWIHDYQLGGIILYDMDLEYNQLGLVAYWYIENPECVLSWQHYIEGVKAMLSFVSYRHLRDQETFIFSCNFYL